MKTIIFLFTLLFFASSNTAQTYEITDSDTSAYYTLTRGSTLKVKTNLVYVYTNTGQRKLFANQIKLDSLVALTSVRLVVVDSINSLKTGIENHLNSIIKIQNQSYDSLLSFMAKSDSLVVRSTKNTDKALSYIDKIKWTSYGTGAVMGGLSFGFAFGNKNDALPFSWVGALGGAVVGALLNYFLLK